VIQSRATAGAAVAGVRGRQTFAPLHMLDLPGRRAEDVQLLEVPGYGGMCARLVFLPVSHARL
jgi:hypothetical protein